METMELMETITRTNKRVWYSKGLRFECNQCGKCCRGEPGVVWVDPGDIIDMAGEVKMQVGKFSEKYVRKISTRYSLRELANGDCVMYKDGCRVYSTRPVQCLTFPFWSDSLKSKESWEALKDECPGIDVGRLYSAAEIRKILKASGE